MTQIELGWGSGPSKRYEALAVPFLPLFQRIGTTAVARELDRKLPELEITALRAAGFTAVRVPTEFGGSGASLPELFNLLIELSEVDSNVTNAVRAHFGFTADVINASGPRRSKWLSPWVLRPWITFGKEFAQRD